MGVFENMFVHHIHFKTLTGTLLMQMFLFGPPHTYEQRIQYLRGITDLDPYEVCRDSVHTKLVSRLESVELVH